MRRPSACAACRARRRKCIYPENGTAAICEYCSSHALQCLQGPPEGGYYAKRKARLQSTHGPPQTSLGQAGLPSRQPGQELPPIALRRELVELYFDYIHDQFHSMYHRSSFIEDVMNDRVPTIVLLAMFALSARFSINEAFDGTDPRERGECYRTRSEELFNIRDLNPTTVQVCVLLGAYAAASGQTDVENIYYSMGGRMCLALDLPNRPVIDLVEREVNIRIWWTLCMVDVWSSTAVRLPRIMPFDSAVPLPIDEIPFISMGTSPRHGCIDASSSVSSPLLAEMVKLNRILSRIIDFNRVCVSEHLEGMPLEKGIRELSRDLDVWLEDLPQHMRDTPANFEYFASRGHGRMFVAVYLGYYHYGQLLNYQFLSSSVEASPESGRWRDESPTRIPPDVPSK
ncbi:c6 transcription factor [Stemphylium lycopersici]|uniref:C6 transcription factor n=1 Tax=Stemphylium lycopersici TaxID=183478 RepID=A0A364MVI4_STELY|nr:c6 transcription factor [Stemphylium lycopersici]RAR00840.1 c6 transcription factor [Stemphylium lycopersici]RAR04612.1 c6 transcription factor [Stemphylium lycopersici]